MSSILQLPAAQALAWALVHFVWQGAAIALVLAAVQRLGRLSASARYVTGVLAMAAMLAVPAITFVTLAQAATRGAAAVLNQDTASAVAAPGTQYPAPSTPPSPAESARQAPAPGTLMSSVAPGVILGLWGAGVVLLSLRLLGGWLVARRLARRSTSPAGPEIQALARRIAGRLALDRVVGVFESSAVSVPVMIGWMKPVVLLPAAALAGLSVPQVEALIAHELAHVRRHDYLVNLLQSAVETLLFYHPAVWWVSRRLRVDRELCCDDVALEVCDRLVYATALSELAAMTTTPRLALAATDGPLLHRVRRILGRSVDGQDSGSGWLSVCLVVLLILSLSGALAPSVLTSGRQTPRDGVQSGVAGGVQSGVVGGVQPGVVGGVPGVVGGVAGVQGTARPASPPDAARAMAQTGDARAADQSTAREDAIKEELRKIAQARAENEYQRTSTQSKARLVTYESDLRLLREQLERAKQQVEVGMLSSTSLAELQAKIAGVEQQIAAERAEVEYQAREVELRRREADLEGQLSSDSRDRLKAQVDKIAAADQTQAAAAVQADRKRELAAAALDKSLTAFADRGKALTEAAVALGPSEVARAGDIVQIAIHNEPDLPTTFVVQPDGTIRFPLVGAIRVQGLTARQVQETVGKQLSERKLAAGSGLDVTLLRPKG